MKLYVVRHGQTDWNKNNIIQGRTDIPLNREGMKEAEELGENLKDVPFDIAYVSPLTRAKQTARAVLIYHPETKVVYDERLVEMCYGEQEGTTRLGTDYEKMKERVVYRHPKGESYFDVAARIYPFLKETLTENLGKKYVLFVCHGRLMAFIDSYFRDMTNEEFFRWNPPNGKARIYEVTADLIH